MVQKSLVPAKVLPLVVSSALRFDVSEKEATPGLEDLHLYGSDHNSQELALRDCV